jgi:hypothetical protein
MKKTITHPDKSEEVIEGTADEIAQYEKAKREQANESPKPSKKKILLTEEVVRAIAREEAAKQVQPVRYEFHSHCIGCTKCQPISPYPWYTQPIWIGTPDPLVPYIGDPIPGSSGIITVTSDGTGKTETRVTEIPKTTIPFIGTFCSNSAQA